MPFIVDHATDPDLLFTPLVDGERKGHGHDPNQVLRHALPQPPSAIKLIPRSEWSARIKERKELQAGLRWKRRRHMSGNRIPSSDQNGHGYCWFYSSTGCVTLARMRDNLPYVRLNAHSGAAIIKRGRDEGGWCGLSAQFIMEHGVADFDHWPEHSRNLANDKPETRANMAKYKVTEGFFDLSTPAYNRNLTHEMIATLLLTDQPCAVDFNEWGHSVVAIDWDEPEPGSFCPVIWNSWTDGWGEHGEGHIRRWDVDGAVGLVVPTAA